MVRAGALDDNMELPPETTMMLDPTKKATLNKQIESMAEVLKNGLNSKDAQLISGIDKFLIKFHNLRSSGRLASALHSFGTETRRRTSLVGFQRWGKRIGVQATASGRRKYGSRGKAQVLAGRPRTSYVNKSEEIKKNTRYTLPMRKKNQMEKKRPHNLSKNIQVNKQNAGKW